MEEFSEYIQKQATKWFKTLYRKIKKNPKLIIVLLVALYIAFYMGKLLFEEFGIITLVGYVATIIWRITKVADKPERTVIWGVGFYLGALIVKIVPEMLLPFLKDWNLVSIASGLIVAGILLDLYLTSRRLKKR